MRTRSRGRVNGASCSAAHNQIIYIVPVTENSVSYKRLPNASSSILPAAWNIVFLASDQKYLAKCVSLCWNSNGSQSSVGRIERDNGELVRQRCGPCLLPCLRVDIHTPVNAVCVARACIAVSLHTHLCVCVCVCGKTWYIHLQP